MGRWGAVLHITGTLPGPRKRFQRLAAGASGDHRWGGGVLQPWAGMGGWSSQVPETTLATGETKPLCRHVIPLDWGGVRPDQISPLPTGPPCTTGLITFSIHSLTAGLIKSVFNWIRSSRDGALPSVFNPQSSVKCVWGGGYCWGIRRWK